MKKIRNFIMIALCTLLLATGCGSESKVIFSEGTWEGNKYTNEFLGLTYTMPEDWERTSDEELDNLIKQAMSLTEMPTTTQKLAELAIYYYFMTMSPTGSNVILASEKIPVSVTVEEFAEGMKSKLEEQELNYVLSDVKMETIGSKEFATIEASVSYIKQKYYIYKIDKYIIYLGITGLSDEEIANIVDQFQFN